MAVQELSNKRTPYGMLYSGIGEGIGAGIEGGAEDYLRRQGENELFLKNRTGLQAFTKDPEMAEQLALLSPALQLQAIKDLQKQEQIQKAQQQAEVAQSKLQKLKEQENLQKDIFKMQKFHKKELNAIAEDARKADEEEEILNQIDEIIASGKYQGPDWIFNALDKFGLGYEYRNAETELAQKLMQKLVFANQLENGGTLTDAKLKAYEKANLSLMNNPEGAKLIIDTMRLGIKKRKAIEKSRNKFIKKYEGQVLPHTLDEIYEGAQNQEEKYAKKEQNIDKKYAHYIGKYLKESNEKESKLGTLGRGVLRAGARAGEALAGLPGDILSGVNSAVEYGLGIKTPYSRFKEGTGVAPIPTSENIKDHVTKGLTGEYLEPQGGKEEFVDNVVKDIATMWAPGKIASMGVKGVSKLASFFASPEGFSLGKQAARAAGSNLAGLLGEKIFDSKIAGGVAKLGTLALTSIPSTEKILGDEADRLYGIEKSILQKEKPRIQPEKVSDKMHELENWTQSGLKEDVEAKDQIFKSLKKLDANISNEGILISDLLESRRDIASKLRNGEYNKVAAEKAKELQKVINEEIQEYGKTNQPFITALNEGDAIYTAKKINQEKNKFVENLIPKDAIKSKLGKAIIFGSGVSGVAFAPKIALGLLAGYPLLKAGAKARAFVHTVKSNAPTQKYLVKFYEAAIKKDKNLLVNSAKNLDKILLKQERE